MLILTTGTTFFKYESNGNEIVALKYSATISVVVLLKLQLMKYSVQFQKSFTT